MRWWYYKTLALLLLSAPLSSALTGDTSSSGIPLADVEGDPSSTIAGCVSAITGSFTESGTPLRVVAPEPLIFSHFSRVQDCVQKLIPVWIS